MSESTAITVAAPVAVAGISQDQYDRQESFRQDLERNLPQIIAVLPKGVRHEVLTSASMTAALDNPKLLDCSPLSMFRAVLKAATLGLRIGEQCDLVPIGGKVECWVRVRGVVDLAVRAGAIRWAREGYVCAGDEFEHEERAEGTHFRHRALSEPKADASNVTHVYATIVLRDGTRVFEVWSMARCLEHKKRFAKDTKAGSVWDKHPLPMFAKSVVKAALRFAPLSPDVRSAMGAGDEVEGSYEVVGDPAKALASASSALDALALMDGSQDADASRDGSTTTLVDAEAMAVRGKPLRDIKTPRLTEIRAWAVENDNVRLAMSCDIVLAAREDAALSDESEDAAA